MTMVFGIFAFLAALLAILLAVVAGLFAVSVLLSFSIAWYERANADPALDAQRRHALAVKLLLGEFTCLFMTLLLRPLGWLPSRMPAGRGRRPPIILLHGLFQNRSCLFPLQWRLRAAGYDRQVSINTPAWRDLDQQVDALAATVAAIRTASGDERVYLVGHSMGGLLARCYLQRPGAAAAVAGCVSIGTPHQGSRMAPFAISRHGRHLRPGSPLLNRLNGAPLPADVHFTAIYSRHDNIIVPVEHARLAGAENIELTGLGHTALLFSCQTAAAVVEALQLGGGASRPGTSKFNSSNQ
jgi:triacylglycerol esterase/lipase EstA (alpha/beta hydrolase family)